MEVVCQYSKVMLQVTVSVLLVDKCKLRAYIGVEGGSPLIIPTLMKNAIAKNHLTTANEK